jgi:hypothetical protein
MTVIRCGNHVRHVPPGETWASYVDGEWRAWQEGEVEASDCAVIVLRLLDVLEELGR